MSLPASFALMLLGVQPFVTHAYELCWWSLIAVLDGVVWWRTGVSPIARAPFRFLLLSLWSVAWWFVFEVINLRLENWYYIYVGAGAAGRWIGSCLAFATVLPAIHLFAEALRSFGLFAAPASAERVPRAPDWLPPALCVLGVAFLVLPLIWPRYLYPLVWGGLVLLLDPLNRRRGAGSLLAELEGGVWSTFLLYLAAGLLAGLFWEFLNYWARVKWVYTVPFFEDWKLFEMPLLGFLGFPPFAVECWVAMEALTSWKLLPRSGEASHGREGLGRRAALLAVALLASGIAGGIALPAMDRATFASLYPLIDDLPDLDPALRDELRERGWTDCFELRKDLERRGDAGSPLHRRLELVLFHGIGIEKAAALERVGVSSISELARAEPVELHQRLSALGLRHPARPAEIRYWVRKARSARAG